MAARKSLGGAGLPPLADLFSTSDERALEAQTQERVMMLPVSELHNFPGHPFQVRDDEEMEKLAQKQEAAGSELRQLGMKENEITVLKFSTNG